VGHRDLDLVKRSTILGGVRTLIPVLDDLVEDTYRCSVSLSRRKAPQDTTTVVHRSEIRIAHSTGGGVSLVPVLVVLVVADPKRA
jgi:hypothetical protein